MAYFLLYTVRIKTQNFPFKETDNNNASKERKF